MKTLTLAIVFLASSLAAQDDIKDDLTTKSGRKLRGIEITEMTATSIKFKRDDEEDEIPASTLATIEWSNPPEQLALAEGAMRKREFENAANLYDEAATQTERSVIQAEAAFFAAQAMVRSAELDASKADTAVSKLEAFVTNNPEHYRTAEAELELGRAHLLAGDPKSAEETLTTLSSKVATQGLDPLWDVRAKFEIAQAQLQQGNFAAARTSFRRAKSAADGAAAQSSEPNPALQSYVARSIVGEGETFAVEGKFDDALKYFERFQRDDDPIVASAAKAGTGEALYLKAQAENTKDGLRRAQIVLAEANLDDITGGATTAKAMYYSGLVIMALGADRESTDFMARARSYFDSVAEHYPETTWATKAREQMN